MENIIMTINLFVHLLATVAFIGGPFYMLLITKKRKQMGIPFDYPMDRYLENIIEGQPKKCFIYLAFLVFTGFGFPIIHYAFQGSFKSLSSLSLSILIIKHLVIVVALGLMTYMYFVPATKVRIMMQEIETKFDKKPPQDIINSFAQWRAKRRGLCKDIFIIQICILILTAMLRFLV